ncbi:hypothetical protein OROMI_000887 [Orobanche minor]
MPPVHAQSGVPSEERPSPASPHARPTMSHLPRASFLASDFSRYQLRHHQERHDQLLVRWRFSSSLVASHNSRHRHSSWRPAPCHGCRPPDLSMTSCAKKPATRFSSISAAPVQQQSDFQTRELKFRGGLLNCNDFAIKNSRRSTIIDVQGLLMSLLFCLIRYPGFDGVETLGSLDKLSVDNLFKRGLVGAAPVSRFNGLLLACLDFYSILFVHACINLNIISPNRMSLLFWTHPGWISYLHGWIVIGVVFMREPSLISKETSSFQCS